MNNADERLYYECAKYATFLELYVEAWDYINKCTIYLYYRKEDVIWLKQLKICYLCYFMKKSPNDNFSLSRDYIDIGNFTKIINDLEENDDISNILEVSDYFLEGLIYLYHYDESLISNEIIKWEDEIVFILSCSSYCRSIIENEKCLLTISKICLKVLDGKSYKINTESLTQVSKTINKSYNPVNESSIIITKINILFVFANISKQISENLMIDLYYKNFELLFQIENLVSIKDYYIKYENNVIDYIIQKFISDIKFRNTKDLSNNSLLVLSNILIERQYFTITYLLVFNYFIDKNLWISSYNVINKSIKYIPNIDDHEEKELLDKVENKYLELQNYKINFSDCLLKVIDVICNDKQDNFLINNWINECFILNETQYIIITKSKNLLKIYKDKYKFEDFKNFEKVYFINKLYEFFGIPCSSDICWIPEKYIDPIIYLENIVNNQLKKSNGDVINGKMIEAIKKMISLGKSIDDVAFFYNIPIVTINKILGDL
jgi:hypothetical protein